MMNDAKMKELKIFNGDPVLLRGKRRNKTLCIAIRDNKLEAGKIAINKVVRNNLKIKLGDLVTVTNVE
jgi:transitional endoplasmic reticulum ATPase